MQVQLRGRVHTVRGKGKSCFIVLRQARATVQVIPNLERHNPAAPGQKLHTSSGSAWWIVLYSRGAGGCLQLEGVPQVFRGLVHAQVILFVDDKTVSKGMVKYATAIPRESIVDVSGEVHVPETPVAGCTCSKVSLVGPLVCPYTTWTITAPWVLISESKSCFNGLQA